MTNTVILVSGSQLDVKQSTYYISKSNNPQAICAISLTINGTDTIDSDLEFIFNVSDINMLSRELYDKVRDL